MELLYNILAAVPGVARDILVRDIHTVFIN
jgi:hypothetical protein